MMLSLNQNIETRIVSSIKDDKPDVYGMLFQGPKIVFQAWKNVIGIN